MKGLEPSDDHGVPDECLCSCSTNNVEQLLGELMELLQEMAYSIH